MFRKLTLAASVAVTLSGCMIGNIYNSPALEEISSLREARAKVRNGMSMDQVQSALGTPSNRSIQNNTTIWFYTSSGMNLGGREVLTAGLGGYVPSTRRTVTVQFNSTGRVNDVTYNEVTL